MPPLQALPSLVISRPVDAADDPFGATAPQGAIAYKEALANPGPLGLFAFALTCAFLSGVNADITESKGGTNQAACLAVFYGGLAQIMAAIFDMRRGSTFGATTFTAYGMYWLGFGLYTILGSIGVWDGSSHGRPSAHISSVRANQMMNSLYGLLTTIFFVATLRMNRALQALFFGLGTLYYLLAIGATVPVVQVIAGWWGLAVSATAFYTGSAELYNEVFGRTVLPLGVVTRGTAKPVPAKGQPVGDAGV